MAAVVVAVVTAVVAFLVVGAPAAAQATDPCFFVGATVVGGEPSPEGGSIWPPAGAQFRNRDYDPSHAVFTTRDPLDGIPGTPTETSPYHDADNDPVNKSDPLGLSPDDSDEGFEPPIDPGSVCDALELATGGRRIYAGRQASSPDVYVRTTSGRSATISWDAAIAICEAAAFGADALIDLGNAIDQGDRPTTPGPNSGGGGTAGPGGGGPARLPAPEPTPQCDAPRTGADDCDGDPIVLGLEAYGLRETATRVGGRHLLDDPNRRFTFLEALGDPLVRFTISLDGLDGVNPTEQLRTAVHRGASGNPSPTNWGIAQLHQVGRLSMTSLVEDRGRRSVPNPWPATGFPP